MKRFGSALTVATMCASLLVSPAHGLTVNYLATIDSAGTRNEYCAATYDQHDQKVIADFSTQLKTAYYQLYQAAAARRTSTGGFDTDAIAQIQQYNEEIDRLNTNTRALQKQLQQARNEQPKNEQLLADLQNKITTTVTATNSLLELRNTVAEQFIKNQSITATGLTAEDWRNVSSSFSETMNSLKLLSFLELGSGATTRHFSQSNVTANLSTLDAYHFDQPTLFWHYQPGTKMSPKLRQLAADVALKSRVSALGGAVNNLVGSKLFHACQQAISYGIGSSYELDDAGTQINLEPTSEVNLQADFVLPVITDSGQQLCQVTWKQDYLPYVEAYQTQRRKIPELIEQSLRSSLPDQAQVLDQIDQVNQQFIARWVQDPYWTDNQLKQQQIALIEQVLPKAVQAGFSRQDVYYSLNADWWRATENAFAPHIQLAATYAAAGNPAFFTKEVAAGMVKAYARVQQQFDYSDPTVYPGRSALIEQQLADRAELEPLRKLADFADHFIGPGLYAGCIEAINASTPVGLRSSLTGVDLSDLNLPTLAATPEPEDTAKVIAPRSVPAAAQPGLPWWTIALAVLGVLGLVGAGALMVLQPQTN